MVGPSAAPSSDRRPTLDTPLLLRAVTFTATHRYHRPDWTPERNREVFGANAEPHAHDWRLEVAVTGPLDPATGWTVDLDALDRILDEEVTARFGGSDLHEEIPEVARGEIQPSTEELARWLFRRLADRMPPESRLVRVRLWEGPDLGAEYRPPPA